MDIGPLRRRRRRRGDRPPRRGAADRGYHRRHAEVDPLTKKAAQGRGEAGNGGAGRPAVWQGWLLPLGFGLVAVGLYAGSRPFEAPPLPARSVGPAALSAGPRRVPVTDPAWILVEGVPQRCNGCHRIFRSAEEPGAAPDYHREVRLAHGMNNRCLNCHDAEDREALALRDGTRVAFAQAPLLCAQCHGTVFRDWERGTHGKTLGSWVTGSPAQRRLSCNECHDPHSPRYEPYKPLPGPRPARRMRPGPAAPGGDHEADPGPLRRYLGAPGPGRPAPGGGHP